MQSKWIYILNHKLTEVESSNILSDLREVFENWQAHKIPVSSKIEILESQIILLEALSDASGCSIDWMNKSVSDTLLKYNVSTLDPLHILIKQQENTIYQLNDLISKIENDEISIDTLFYDTTVVHGNTFENLLKPFSKSWIKSKIKEKA